MLSIGLVHNTDVDDISLYEMVVEATTRTGYSVHDLYTMLHKISPWVALRFQRSQVTGGLYGKLSVTALAEGAAKLVPSGVGVAVLKDPATNLYTLSLHSPEAQVQVVMPVLGELERSIVSLASLGFEPGGKWFSPYQVNPFSLSSKRTNQDWAGE